MKYYSKKLALVLFVLSTTMMLGSTTNAFAAAPTSVEMEACLNDFNPDTNPCDTPIEWKGGNIQSDATYQEGFSIPMRIDITDLDTTLAEHTILLGWDLTKTQSGVIHHVFDYITEYDFTDDPHPCLVPHNENSDSKCTDWSSDSEPIPQPETPTLIGTKGGPQPITSWNNNLISEQSVFLFAPTGFVDITSVEYIDEGDPSGEGVNSETASILITFETDNSHVILAYGMHVAGPEDWENTAGGVDGQSAQVRWNRSAFANK